MTAPTDLELNQAKAALDFAADNVLSDVGIYLATVRLELPTETNLAHLEESFTVYCRAQRLVSTLRGQAEIARRWT